MKIWATQENIKNFYIDLPPGVLESNLDDLKMFHNDNGPAIITADNVYFIEHGIDWNDEKYETYIRQLFTEIASEIPSNEYPFNQIESIVLTSKGWGQRKRILPGHVNIYDSYPKTSPVDTMQVDYLKLINQVRSAA